MKRLFQVNKPNGQPTEKVDTDGKVVGVYYASCKKDAKEARDALNAEHKGGGYTVSPGPDHKGLATRKSRGHLFRNRTHQARS